jgi:hypothetical protein
MPKRKLLTKAGEKVLGDLLLKRMEDLQLIMKDVYVVCNILDIKLQLVKIKKGGK